MISTKCDFIKKDTGENMIIQDNNSKTFYSRDSQSCNPARQIPMNEFYVF